MECIVSVSPPCSPPVINASTPSIDTPWTPGQAVPPGTTAKLVQTEQGPRIALQGPNFKLESVGREYQSQEWLTKHSAYFKQQNLLNIQQQCSDRTEKWVRNQNLKPETEPEQQQDKIPPTEFASQNPQSISDNVVTSSNFSTAFPNSGSSFSPQNRKLCFCFDYPFSPDGAYVC